MKILGLVILALFYAVYLGKMLLQRRRGIQTDQIARGKRRNKVFWTELLLKIATYAVVVVELVSVFTSGSQLPTALRVLGALLGLAGNALFFVAVYTMRDSWRAGIAENDTTKLVTDGIYAYSRNPAFLAFDLVYIGLLMMFFNMPLLLFSLFAAVMLHLQVLQEEQYLVRAFGQPYLDYQRRVRRYLGRRASVQD